MRRCRNVLYAAHTTTNWAFSLLNLRRKPQVEIDKTATSKRMREQIASVSLPLAENERFAAENERFGSELVVFDRKIRMGEKAQFVVVWAA